MLVPFSFRISSIAIICVFAKMQVAFEDWVQVISMQQLKRMTLRQMHGSSSEICYNLQLLHLCTFASLQPTIEGHLGLSSNRLGKFIDFLQVIDEYQTIL